MAPVRRYTRKLDLVEFQIHMQARSPEGPCELRSMDGKYVHLTTNDQLRHEFLIYDDTPGER